MERVWWRRLRWRLRGAWLWPAFTVLTLVDAVVLHAWPVSGLGIDFMPALLLVGFVNLLAVAVGAPLVGRLLRRRRHDLPKAVAADYAGVALLVAVALTWTVAGLRHRGEISDERAASAKAVSLMRAAVLRDAPAGVRANLPAADTIRVDPNRLYRSCIPTGRPERPWCLLVHLDRDPPRIVFSGREPNWRWGPQGW